MTWPEAIAELNRVRFLETDWDGKGFSAPHPDLVDGALRIAHHLQRHGGMPPDRIHASVNGTVYFEWHTPRGIRAFEIVDIGEYREIPILS